MSVRAVFSDRKRERRCNWLMREFTSRKAFQIFQSREEMLEYVREHKLSHQHMGERQTYFVTDEGWRSFRDFVRELHQAEPFCRRCSYQELFSAVSSAFTWLLDQRLVPDDCADLIEHLPAKFVQSITDRSETLVYGLRGVDIECGWFIQVGACWIGTFGTLSFATIPDDKHKSFAMDALNDVFENSTPVLVGRRISGSSDFVDQEFHADASISLAIVDVMLMLTYERALSNLRLLSLVDSPYCGRSRHFSFSFYSEPDAPLHLTLKTGYGGQVLKISEEMIGHWHEGLWLSRINEIAQQRPEHRTDLEQRIVRSLHYFRDATLLESVEVQVAVLWISVEAFFTLGAEVGAISAGSVFALAALTHRTMHMDFWPGGADSFESLEGVFRKLYSARSGAAHHARRGHVTRQEVQQFALITPSVIVSMVSLSAQGFVTAESVRRRLYQDFGRL